MRAVQAHDRGLRHTQPRADKLRRDTHCLGLSMPQRRPSLIRLKLAGLIVLLRCAGPGTNNVPTTASRIEHLLANPGELAANRDLLAAVAERHRRSTNNDALAALLRSMLEHELGKLDSIDFAARAEEIDNLRRRSDFATSEAMVSFARKLDLGAVARRADRFLRASESLYLATLSALELPAPITYRDLLRATPTTVPSADRVDGLGQEATALLLERNSIAPPRSPAARASAKLSRLRAFLRHRRLAGELVFEARWLAQPSPASAEAQLTKIAKTLHLSPDSAALIGQRATWGSVALRFRALEISHRLERTLIDSHGENGWRETDARKALDALVLQAPEPGEPGATLGLTAIAELLTGE